MSRKRDKIARRRQVAKTRAGQSRPSKRKGVSGAPPADEPARRAPMMDVWIAVGIVVGVIALLVAAYFIFVRRPAQGINPTVEVNVTTPTEASTPKPMSWSAPPEMALTPGVDYRAMSISFDDEETPKIALKSKPNYMKLIEKEFPDDQWKFFTGDAENIKALTESVGFQRVFEQYRRHLLVLALLKCRGQSRNFKLNAV